MWRSASANARSFAGKRNKPKRQFIMPSLRQATPKNSEFVQPIDDCQWRCRVCGANILAAVISAGAIKHFRAEHPKQIDLLQAELCKASGRRRSAIKNDDRFVGATRSRERRLHGIFEPIGGRMPHLLAGLPASQALQFVPRHSTPQTEASRANARAQSAGGLQPGGRRLQSARRCARR